MRRWGWVLPIPLVAIGVILGAARPALAGEAECGAGQVSFALHITGSPMTGRTSMFSYALSRQSVTFRMLPGYKPAHVLAGTSSQLQDVTLAPGPWRLVVVPAASAVHAGAGVHRPHHRHNARRPTGR